MIKKTIKQGSVDTWGHRRFVTLRGKYGHDEVDLEMPGDVPIGQLLPDLIKALNWPMAEGSQPLRYLIRTESGSILEESETFLTAGIENSDVLWITLAEGIDAEETSESLVDGAETTSEAGPIRGFAPVASTNPSPKDRRGTLAPPRSVRFPIHEPSLISSQGLIFVLGKPPITIGRSSHEHQPDIDLTEIDIEIVSSRQHAEIHADGDRFVLIPKQTTNGTFVNGVELLPEEKHILEDEDVVQFGFEGVELIFLSGTHKDLPSSFFR
jgi:pSer/pThr/pTyr-binding forkhead associated (FHA) protein